MDDVSKKARRVVHSICARGTDGMFPSNFSSCRNARNLSFCPCLSEEPTAYSLQPTESATEERLAKVIAGMTISLDGFVADLVRCQRMEFRERHPIFVYVTRVSASPRHFVDRKRRA